MPDLQLPDKLSLARLPTPLEPLDRLSEQLDTRILVKRDDLTGMALSGNKIRKLEFVLGEALRRDATAVITCGGIQSNHCRATAVAARKLGITPYVMLRTTDGREPSEVDGNYFLDRLVGATVRTITPTEWKSRDALMADWAHELEGRSEQKVFVIPEGASDARGGLGYATMIQELRGQLDDSGMSERDTVYLVHACGSGGTTLGLAVGCHLFWKRALPVSFAVCDDEDYFRSKIDTLADDFAEQFGGIEGAGDLQYLVNDQYKGVGYALSQPHELDFIREIATTEALVLDPVYTGKAFLGMVEELKAGRTFRKNSTVIFVHTGGLYGLFPKRLEFRWE